MGPMLNLTKNHRRLPWKRNPRSCLLLRLKLWRRQKPVNRPLWNLHLHRYPAASPAAKSKSYEHKEE